MAPADVLRVGRHGVEHGAGPEVDYDQRPAVEPQRGDGVGYAVGAQVAWVVVEDLDARPHAGAHDQGLDVEVGAAQVGERRGQRRYDAAHCHGREVRRHYALEGQQVVKQDAVLIGHTAGVRRDPPGGRGPVVGRLPACLEHTQGDVGVAYVQG